MLPSTFLPPGCRAGEDWRGQNVLIYQSAGCGPLVRQKPKSVALVSLAGTLTPLGSLDIQLPQEVCSMAGHLRFCQHFGRKVRLQYRIS